MRSPLCGEKVCPGKNRRYPTPSRARAARSGGPDLAVIGTQTQEHGRAPSSFRNLIRAAAAKVAFSFSALSDQRSGKNRINNPQSIQNPTRRKQNEKSTTRCRHQEVRQKAWARAHPARDPAHHQYHGLPFWLHFGNMGNALREA